MQFSPEFCNILMQLTAKAAKRHPEWRVDSCVTFAWWSVDTAGDAVLNDDDFEWQMALFQELMENHPL